MQFRLKDGHYAIGDYDYLSQLREELWTILDVNIDEQFDEIKAVMKTVGTGNLPSDRASKETIKAHLLTRFKIELIKGDEVITSIFADHLNYQWRVDEIFSKHFKDPKRYDLMYKPSFGEEIVTKFRVILGGKK